MTSTNVAAIARALLDQAADNPSGHPAAPALATGLATGYALLAVAEELAATRAVLVDAAGDTDAGLTALYEQSVAMRDLLGDIAESTDTMAATLDSIDGDLATMPRRWWRRWLHRRGRSASYVGEVQP